ncbi:glycosyltransferase [Pedobacter polaris]|uniref:Glycosyltransferase n=1 Tax=Pedobacter polaris TaxID=2571273 RepID=A0A4U1CZB5_9SPHI|nr:glycosyltransferase [Pedobacter polaris]TKC12898.1 glycosyltransferase [Pedobacter polaris]
MSKNKITRWIDRNNYKVCLQINRKYYRRKSKGSLPYFFIDILLYPYLIVRLLLVLLQIFRFNKNLLQSYSDQKLTTFSSKLSFQISVLFGLRYFVKEEYTPVYYQKNMPLDKLWFNIQNSPKVSIIIPVHNQLQYTLDCLRSLKLNLADNISVEIIVVNDASTDSTAEQIKKINGVRLINNSTNLGFLNSCRKAIESAKGEFICLLNNDTIILKNWLEELLNPIENDLSVGLVGSKLIRPFGLLQEAGGIVYKDGSCTNFGSYQDPNYHAYNYLREADYCTGASILFRKLDYDALNGLDTLYMPAYYEDTDFCFAVRHKLNKKVIYNPLSELVHFEGITSGKNAKKGNVKSYQVLNQIKFAEKWKIELSNYLAPKQAEASVYKYVKQQTLVIVDSYLPRYDKESGSHRVYELIKIFKSLDLHLIFIPDNGKAEQPYYDLLTRNGIEVILNYAGKLKFRNDIVAATKHATYIWACRPGLNKKYSFIRKHKPNVKWIYDTVDLHYIRLEREGKLLNSDKTLTRAKRYKALELSLAKKADITVCITDVEQQLLINEGISNTMVVPNIHALPLNTVQNKFDQRKDLLFVGSYDHTPNVDAAIWLCNDIMPLIWKQNPDIKIHLVGNNPKKEVLSLANDKIKVHGYVEQLEPFFNSCRVFVAPLRYGAGMKGKIGQSLAFGLPIVTTTIGAEGMNLADGEQVCIADDPQEFAVKTIALYENPHLWQKIRENAAASILNYSPSEVKIQLADLFNRLAHQ